jgi:hypothetical protein
MEREDFLELAKKHAEEAKRQAEEDRKAGKTPIEFTLKSGGNSSLGKMIKTKEQADFFMKLLKGL